MNKTDYKQEVHDVIAFYEKHGRELPSYGETLPDGERKMTYSFGWGKFAVSGWKDSHASLPHDAALDLLTIDLMRWARDLCREEKESLTGRLDNDDWVDIGFVKDHKHLFISEAEYLYRALMQAIGNMC